MKVSLRQIDKESESSPIDFVSGTDQNIEDSTFRASRCRARPGRTVEFPNGFLFDADSKALLIVGERQFDAVSRVAVRRRKQSSRQWKIGNRIS